MEDCLFRFKIGDPLGPFGVPGFHPPLTSGETPAASPTVQITGPVGTVSSTKRGVIGKRRLTPLGSPLTP
jgi:hypothetical protein